MNARPEQIWLYDLGGTRAADLTDSAQAAAVWDEIHAVATIQGIVNRDRPRLYLRYVEHAGVAIDDWWLGQLSQAGEWLHGVPRSVIGGLEELVETFRADLAGAVVYDARVPATSNVASTLAGVENLVAVRFDERPGSVYRRLVAGGPRLPVKRDLAGAADRPRFSGQEPGPDGRPLGSAKCAAYHWALGELIASGRCDPAYLGFYIDCDWIQHAAVSVAEHHTLVNHDFFVARRAFFCDLHHWSDEAPVDDPDQPVGTDRRTFEAILGALRERAGDALIHVGGFTPWAFKYTSAPHAGGRHDPVATEWELVRLVSTYDGFLDADAIGLGAMANASFYMHFPLRARYTQPPAPDVAAAGGAGDAADGDDRIYVTIYVGDYDAAAWLYKIAPTLWQDPRRGAAPLSWAISPVLDRRAPMALDHLWRTASDNDAFVAADNGAGYLNPSALSARGLAKWRAHCARYYERWDLAITGFVIDGHAPAMDAAALDAYAGFSPDGIVPQKTAARALLHGDMPVLRSGPDLVAPAADAAAEQVLRHIAATADGMPFHWFRTILRSPGWHADLVAALRQRDARIVVLKAPEFFARLRGRLKAAERGG